MRAILFIFNKDFPKEWKIALVKMILKPGKYYAKVESYRPKSLRPTKSKLFEKLLKSKQTPVLYAIICIPDLRF